MKKSIEAYKERNRRGSNKYHRRIVEKIQSGQILTPKEDLYIDHHNRTPAWAKANQEAHQRYLKRRRERYKEKQAERAKDVNDKV